MFYKLDKSKKYGVEGTNNKIGSEILFYVVLFIFWGIAVAAAALNFNILFLKNCPFKNKSKLFPL